MNPEDVVCGKLYQCNHNLTNNKKLRLEKDTPFMITEIVLKSNDPNQEDHYKYQSEPLVWFLVVGNSCLGWFDLFQGAFKEIVEPWQP